MILPYWMIPWTKMIGNYYVELVKGTWSICQTAVAADASWWLRWCNVESH